MNLRITWLFSVLFYSAFFYHFILVTRDYLSYATITKVDYYSEETSRPPALTIVFGTPIPMEDLFSKVFPNQSYPYKKAGKDVSWNNSSLGKLCDDIYYKFYSNDTREQQNWEKDPGTSLWDCYFHFFGDQTIKDYFLELPTRFGMLERVQYWSQEFEYLNR